MAQCCPGFLWGFIWFLLLIFVAWPVGFMIAFLYIFLMPFGVCIEPLKGVCEAILKLVQLPMTCTENMMNMKPLCS